MFESEMIAPAYNVKEDVMTYAMLGLSSMVVVSVGLYSLLRFTSQAALTSGLVVGGLAMISIALHRAIRLEEGDPGPKEVTIKPKVINVKETKTRVIFDAFQDCRPNQVVRYAKLTTDLGQAPSRARAKTFNITEVQWALINARLVQHQWAKKGHRINSPISITIPGMWILRGILHSPPLVSHKK